MGQVGRSPSVPSPDDALKAYRDGGLAAFATSVNDQLKRELSQKKPADDAIVRLATLHSFAGRLAATQPASPADTATLQWLINSRRWARFSSPRSRRVIIPRTSSQS